MAELYHDVDIQERLEISPGGQAHKVYKVTAYTRSGVHFTVDVKEADFTREKVDKVLKDQAALIEGIKQL
jgi:hypothetical protein